MVHAIAYITMIMIELPVCTVVQSITDDVMKDDVIIDDATAGFLLAGCKLLM